MTATAIKIPALRFPEFEGEWEIKKVEQVLKRVGKPVTVENDQMYQQIGIRSHGKGLFHKELVTGEELGGKRVFWVVPDSFIVNIVFAWEQAVAKTTAFEEGMIASHRFPMFQSQEKHPVDLDFILHFFLTNKGKVILEAASPGGAGRNKTLGQKEFERQKIFYPTLPEQQKIAAFLTTIDTRIQQLSRKKALLEQYKKGVMQRIFSQEIRFKDEGGKEFPAWEEKRLGEIFERVTRKNNEDNQNVLTISAQQGLVSQQDYFNKSVASKDLKGYYLLHKGDFAYNKSYSNGYPLGAIKRLIKYDKGVVSTLYICFKIQPSNSEEYFEQYFESGFLNSEIHKIAQEGARNHGLLNISVVEFFKDIYLPRPSIAEQQKIAAFLSTLDRQINLVSQQLERMQAFKKGLLQQMFV